MNSKIIFILFAFVLIVNVVQINGQKHFRRHKVIEFDFNFNSENYIEQLIK